MILSIFLINIWFITLTFLKVKQWCTEMKCFLNKDHFALILKTASSIYLIRLMAGVTDWERMLPPPSSPAEKLTFWGEPSNVVYSFVLGIKWKSRMCRFRICMMPPWHPWAFCAIQDGVQDCHQFKQTSRTPLLINTEGWFWCQTLCFQGKGIHWNGQLGVEGLIDNRIQDSHHLKEKQQNSYYILHYSDYCGVNCYVSGIKECINISEFPYLPIQSDDYGTKTHFSQPKVRFKELIGI
jgi:hypothetical protein